MRKLLLSLTCLVFATGVVLAAEATLVKFDGDKKEITVKEGEKENTYKITDKTKFSSTGKDGTAKESTYEAASKQLSNEKAVGRKLDITTSGKDVTELKIAGRGGKKKE